eukprot:TRINITY_DN9398_c0_g1_i1.p1 TRINITY_DN9398_c0_g1~~TRINITY_DN9398_c0_g1_i1.p1  ORF type:complete len:372 (+),score=107.18 TRINITY_DN9398_c0_g1_i1:93-1208(+)
MGCLACRPEKTVETQLRAYFLMVEEHYRMALSDGLAAGVASVLYPMPRNPLHNWQELRQSDDDEAAPKMLAALEGALEDYLRQHAPKNANRDSPLGLGIYTPDGPIREKDALGFVAEFVSVLAQCPKAVTGLLAYEELSGELEHLRRHAREGPISETERALCRLLRKQEVCPDELRARLAPVLTEVRLKYRGMHGKFAGSDWLGCITSAVSAIQSRAEGLLCRRDVVLALCPLGDLRTHLHFLNVLGMRVRGDSAVCGDCGSALHEAHVPNESLWSSLSNSTREPPACAVCGDSAGDTTWTCPQCPGYDLCAACHAEHPPSLGAALTEIRNDTIWTASPDVRAESMPFQGSPTEITPSHSLNRYEDCGYSP